MQVARAAAAARDAKATAGRRVWFSRDVDGQALLLARGPAAAIAAIRASLEATLPTDAARDDERSTQAREFDLFVELLTGGEQAGSWQAEVIVPVSVAAGGELELAEIPGLRPILPSTARDLLAQADSLTPVAVDQAGSVIGIGDRAQRRRPDQAPESRETPGTESVLGPRILPALAAAPSPHDLTGSGYRFPPRLRRFLEARDRTCVFPGCGRPARRTDKDHRRPWPAGPTSADNGECLCRHHHRAKHAVFTVTLDADGSYLWTSRGSWQFRRQPKGF